MNLLASDIGIIGGADGPTSVIVTTSDNFYIYIGIAVIIITIIITSIVIKKKHKK